MGGDVTIPFTRMRQRYRELHRLHTAQQLAMARTTKALGLAADFAQSVAAFEEYQNVEPFFETERKPLKTIDQIPEQISCTADFAAVLKRQERRCVLDNQHLDFEYVERELVPARTTGGARYSNGQHSGHLIRLDLLLAGEVPILGELKRTGDKNAFYALIQLLALASELVTESQRKRLWTYHSPPLPDPRESRFDLYLIFHRFNQRSRPKVAILQETRRLAEQLVTFQEINTHVRRIVALDSNSTERSRIVFKERFAYTAQV